MGDPLFDALVESHVVDLVAQRMSKHVTPGDRLAKAVRTYLFAGYDPDPLQRLVRHDTGCASDDPYQAGPCDCGSEALLTELLAYEDSTVEPLTVDNCPECNFVREMGNTALPVIQYFHNRYHA